MNANLLARLWAPLAACLLLAGVSLQAAAARPIFVLNSLDADVSIIDPATYTVLRRLPTGNCLLYTSRCV